MFSELIDDICTKKFHIIDNFLGEELAKELRHQGLELYNNQQFRYARIGQHEETTLSQTIRNDRILWLNDKKKESPFSHYFERIERLKMRLNETLYLGINDLEIHYAIYPENAFYKRHIDQFKSDKARQISCVYYLNESWSVEHGGHLKLYNTNDELLTSVSPILDRFVCFSSDLPHEVERTNQQRISIAGWLKANQGLVF